MLFVRAKEAGYYNSQYQEEGTEFYVLPRDGWKWADEYMKKKIPCPLTPEDQLGSWMEVIEEMDDPSTAPKIVEKIVYRDKPSEPEEASEDKSEEPSLEEQFGVSEDKDDEAVI